jgi:hypothetical protein
MIRIYKVTRYRYGADGKEWSYEALRSHFRDAIGRDVIDKAAGVLSPGDKIAIHDAIIRHADRLYDLLSKLRALDEAAKDDD